MSERIVMVGAGYWSQFQVEGWRDAGAPLVAICEPPPGERRGAGAALRRARAATATSQHMLDAERPTLVDVCLPPVAQEPAVRAAIERGIPTICQKPFGIDLQQAEAMTALAEAAGVPLVVHENFRFAPWFRELRRLHRRRLLRPRARRQPSGCAPATARARRPTWTASPTSSRCPSSWCAKPRCTSSTPSAS